jgi:transcriptional regulator
MSLYQPPHFREDDPAALQRIMQAAHLPILVTTGAEGLIATHMPLTYQPVPGQPGRLIGHLARANPQWRQFDPAQEALAIFQAHEAYISPSWYQAKREHGKVVPTWNYEIVHATGRLEIIEDRQALLDIVTTLTDLHEQPRAAPWRVDDAPSAYIEGQLKGIVGIVLHITKLEGKRKLGQNRSLADRQGVIAGLTADGEADMAALTRASLPA